MIRRFTPFKIIASFYSCLLPFYTIYNFYRPLNDYVNYTLLALIFALVYIFQKKLNFKVILIGMLISCGVIVLAEGIIYNLFECGHFTQINNLLIVGSGLAFSVCLSFFDVFVDK